MRILTVGKNDAGQRLDKFLLKTLKTLPPPLLYKSVRKKKIKVNRLRAEPSQILREGDSVQLFLSEEFFEKDGEDRSFLHLTPRLSLLYEDGEILLLEKQPGMAVHPDEEQRTDTLIDHVKAYLYRKGEYRPDEEQSFAPALCNRIDRGTGGIVIAAKTAEALRCMNELIRRREVKKYYLLASHGHFENKSGTLRHYLIKDSAKNLVRIYEKKPENGKNEIKECITKYRVLEERDDPALTLAQAELLTGRTHQIRAQFSFIGHPLLGDGKYGVNREDRLKGYKYQALYAYRIAFPAEMPEGLPETCLTGIRGKTFQVSPENIRFLQEFFPDAPVGKPE